MRGFTCSYSVPSPAPAECQCTWRNLLREDVRRVPGRDLPGLLCLLACCGACCDVAIVRANVTPAIATTAEENKSTLPSFEIDGEQQLNRSNCRLLGRYVFTMFTKTKRKLQCFRQRQNRECRILQVLNTTKVRLYESWRIFCNARVKESNSKSHGQYLYLVFI